MSDISDDETEVCTKDDVIVDLTRKFIGIDEDNEELSDIASNLRLSTITVNSFLAHPLINITKDTLKQVLDDPNEKYIYAFSSNYTSASRGNSKCKKSDDDHINEYEDRVQRALDLGIEQLDVNEKLHMPVDFVKDVITPRKAIDMQERIIEVRRELEQYDTLEGIPHRDFDQIFNNELELMRTNRNIPYATPEYVKTLTSLSNIHTDSDDLYNYKLAQCALDILMLTKSRRKSNKGRKRKEKSSNSPIERKTQGSGSCFNSQITCSIRSVKYPSTKIYNVKIFTNGALSIPGVFDIYDLMHTLAYLFGIFRINIIHFGLSMINLKTFIPTDRLISAVRIIEALENDDEFSDYICELPNINHSTVNNLNNASITFKCTDTPEWTNNEIINNTIRDFGIVGSVANGKAPTQYLIKVYSSGKIGIQGNYNVSEIIEHISILRRALVKYEDTVFFVRPDLIKTNVKFCVSINDEHQFNVLGYEIVNSTVSNVVYDISREVVGDTIDRIKSYGLQLTDIDDL